MVDGAGNDQTSLHASKLSGLKDGSHRLEIRSDTDGVVVRLEATGKGSAGSSRVGDQVVGSPGADQTPNLFAIVSVCGHV